MPSSTPQHDPPRVNGGIRTGAECLTLAAIVAPERASLLEAVAAGGVHLVVSTDSGARMALVGEQELLDLRRAAAEAISTPVVLTEREREVLLAIELGLPVAQVAERLGIAHSTAVQHLAATRRKLGVRTSAQAAIRAREAGQLG